MLTWKSKRRNGQRGLGLVELMVGMTVGLIVVAGASVLMVNQLDDHRRLMLETQVQQDLRAAADLMLRDLRRAGFRMRSDKGVWAKGAAAPQDNPYDTVSIPETGGISYSHSKDSNDVAAGNYGFRLSGGNLQFMLNGSWQPLTDSNTLVITDFSVNLNSQQIPLAEFCDAGCATTASCLEVRDVLLSLTGHAARDDKIVRTVTVGTRVRNDAISGAC